MAKQKGVQKEQGIVIGANPRRLPFNAPKRRTVVLIVAVVLAAIAVAGSIIWMSRSSTDNAEDKQISTTDYSKQQVSATQKALASASIKDDQKFIELQSLVPAAYVAGDYTTAINGYETLVGMLDTHNLSDHSVFLYAAQAYDKLGEQDKAITALEKAKEVDQKIITDPSVRAAAIATLNNAESEIRK